jgi:hypothetical protein
VTQDEACYIQMKTIIQINWSPVQCKRKKIKNWFVRTVFIIIWNTAFFRQERSSWIKFASCLFGREWPWNEHALCEQSLAFHAEGWKKFNFVGVDWCILTVDLHRKMAVEPSNRGEERISAKHGLGPQISHICRSHLQIQGARRECSIFHTEDPEF